MEERRTGRSPAGRAGRARLALGVWSGDDATDVWVHWDICAGHGIDDGVDTRELTADALAPFIGVAYGGGTSKSVPTRTATTPPGRWPVARRTGLPSAIVRSLASQEPHRSHAR
jgi:hypothetical protein